MAEKPLLADIAPPQGTLVAVMLIYRRGSGIGGSKKVLLGYEWYQSRQISKFFSSVAFITELKIPPIPEKQSQVRTLRLLFGLAKQRPIAGGFTGG